MNLKLKKVVKNNVVDYGTQKNESRGFEHKFQIFSIIKDYKDIFSKKSQNNSHKKQRNLFNTERQSNSNIYYKKILLHKRIMNKLKTIRNKFKSSVIKNNQNNLNNNHNTNHITDIFRLRKSQDSKTKSPFYESFYQNFWQNKKINNEEFKRTNSNLINNISNINTNETNYQDDKTKYKKINYIKKYNLKIKHKILLGKKYDQFIKTSSSINFFNNSFKKNSNIVLLKNLKHDSQKVKSFYNDSEKNQDIFKDYEFDDFKTMQCLKKKYQFFHENKLDLDEINTRYFLLLRNMLKYNPGVKLRRDSKESQRIINKIKNKYYNRKIKK